MNSVYPSAREVSVAQGPQRRAENIKFAWSRGVVPDTRAALAGDPDLLADKSIVLDLAYEEYCLRREAGENPDIEDFCNAFSPYRSSLRRLLAAHQFLADNPRLLDGVAPVRWPEVGQLFGDHTLIRELGRGSFARVFLATEASTGDRLVAVKLSMEGAAEAKTLGRLDHLNIVPILSARQDEGGLSVVCMPYLGSATLHDVLDKAYPEQDSPPPSRARAILDALAQVSIAELPAPARPVDAVFYKGSYVDAVIHLGVQMADALAFIHARNIYHRDFKPSNILLDPSGRPLVLDFNLSSDKRLSSGRAGGTLPYMAPEQVRQFVLEGEAASAAEPDGRADIFSLGVVLYELLTGKNPYGPLPHGLPPSELARALVARQEHGCRPLREFNPAVSPKLARLIEQCLAPTPEARPPDAATVARAFRQHFAFSAQLQRWARRRPKVLASVACMVLLTISATVWSAATLPPVGDRAYKNGRDAYIAGKYKEADQYFEQALKARRKDFATLFARGQTRLALASDRADVVSALDYFQQANAIRDNDGKLYALLAYCNALREHFDYGEEFGGKAFEAGFANAAVYGNRAYCRYQLRRGSKVAEAKEDIRMALEMDSNFVSAYYTRAHLAFNDWLRLCAAPLTEQSVSDIDYVLDFARKRHRENMQLYLDAAYIYAAAAYEAKDAHADKSVKYLGRAYAMGADPNQAKDRAFKRLYGNPGFPPKFGQIKPMPQAAAKISNNLFLTNPFTGLAD